MSLLAGPIGLFLVLTASDQFGRVLGYCNLVLFCQIICLVVHEAGHGLAAILVRFRLFSISFGTTGNVLLAYRLFGCQFDLRTNLIDGMTVAAPRKTTFLRVRLLFYYLGGPLTNALLAGFLILLCMWLPGRPIIVAGSLVLAASNSLLAVISLFPTNRSVGNACRASDGLAILKLPAMSIDEMNAFHGQFYYLEGIQSQDAGKLEEAERWFQRGLAEIAGGTSNLLMLATILLELRRFSEARDAYLKLHQQPDTTPELRALLENNIAWTDLMIAEPGQLEEADRFSKEAIEATPWESYVKGTRGSVLIELGRIDEGTRLVIQSLAASERPSSKALNTCYLAIAAARQGNSETAKKLLDEAKKSDPNCALLDRTVAELQREPNRSSNANLLRSVDE